MSLVCHDEQKITPESTKIPASLNIILDRRTGFLGVLAKGSGRMGNLYDWSIQSGLDILLERKSYGKLGGNTLDVLF